MEGGERELEKELTRQDWPKWRNSDIVPVRSIEVS